MTFDFGLHFMKGVERAKIFWRGRSKSRNIRYNRTLLRNQGLTRNIMRNIVSRIGTKLKRGFNTQKCKGVASDQFPIEIGRRVKNKKAQRKLGEKKAPFGAGLAVMVELNISELGMNIHFG